MKDVRSKLLVVALGAAFSWAAQAGQVPAKDVPYPGMLTLKVDLSDAPKKIFRVHETIPAKPGAFTLYYPQWIPGEHSPSGPIDNLAGLVITANGKRVPWRRDLRDMYTLHLDVPEGADALELDFQFLSPGEGGQFGASPSSTPNLVDLEFNQVAFYPAGYYTRQIRIQPTVTLPAGWQFASAMEVLSRDGASTTFKPLSFNNFVDSPLVAGVHFNRVDLNPGGDVPVHLTVVADEADQVKLSGEQLKQHRALVDQTGKLFGAHHYEHYDFLLTLSDHTGHFGLEHHQSSDDRLPADMLGDDSLYTLAADLMPHEYVHSWCGKFRRPAKLWAPDFNTVEEDDLLWVYEGLTDYWAGVLTARSGMWTAAQYRDSMASIAAAMSARTGRSWRSLQDTADAAPLTYFGGGGWANYRRGTDFYPEGQLLWLDVDTQIRALSGGSHSLDDFARAFFGMDDGSYVTRTYTFDDVVDGLNQVQPYDWKTFLRTRLDYTGDALPEHGIARGGWKLVYTDTPNAQAKAAESFRHNVNLAHSLGLSASKSGNIYDVQWDGPAFRAGLVPGLAIVAVNGKDFSPERLKDAVAAAKTAKAPIDLLVKNVDVYTTVKVDYHGGLKYPHLVRADGKDRLTAITTPRK
ncbi:M61 family metallopeptidase [Frateuria hangzhouensis]|uniref:M61 family metallopeptidase n=1 Tax=Frateuria hangzhouensis TaxID=2995589 RepID=UPI002260C784|nr:M61 family peptidase [Frateuria sp. STR12]MCX7512567.1 M61 family peptidase [Frateuria sp. STR12]